MGRERELHNVLSTITSIVCIVPMFSIGITPCRLVSRHYGVRESLPFGLHTLVVELNSRSLRARHA
jgi:hypothetical protein